MRRRDFLAAALGGLLGAAGPASVASEVRRATYGVDVGILYDLLSFRLTGTIEETVDSQAARYAVTLAGEGPGIANHLDSSGVLRQGRWAPLRSTGTLTVRGRESRTDVVYDYAREVIQYRARSETFFLRRLRVVDDTLSIAGAGHVDDAISAMLNYAERRWPAGPDGVLRTRVVRRQRRDDEGPDDTEREYRAELVPLVLRVGADAGPGRGSAQFDLTRFSSWARSDRPASIVFGPDRRPEVITAPMILGTTVTIRLAGA